MDRRAESAISQQEKVSPLNRAVSIARNGARIASALFLAAMAPTVARAQETVIEDDGRFPQCADVKIADRSILFEDPSTDQPPYLGVHRQLKRGIQTLSENGLNEVTGMDLYPQGSKLRLFSSVSSQLFCLPDWDWIKGRSRMLVQTSAGAGMGMLTSNSKDDLIEVDLPEGTNIMRFDRYAPRLPGAQPEVQRWLVVIIDPNESVTIRKPNANLTVKAKGPLSIPMSTTAYGESVEIIQPETGFANDKPVPQQ